MMITNPPNSSMCPIPLDDDDDDDDSSLLLLASTMTQPPPPVALPPITPTTESKPKMIPRRTIFIIIIIVFFVVMMIVVGGLRQPNRSTSMISTNRRSGIENIRFHPPPHPLRSSRSTTSHHHHYNYDDDHTVPNYCPYYYNATTNQCFLYPKIDSSTSTTIPSTTSTSRRQPQHRQLPYELGGLLQTANTDGIRLSQGLTATIVARQGQRVTSRSFLPFHRKPDGADIFTLPNNQYVYMSNSERNIPFTGGVYGVIFDAEHRIVDYKNYIRRTTRNCNGGRTPWDTWVTCEEPILPLPGHCWQIDPLGQRRAQKLTMSGFWGGSYEAFAYDVRDTVAPSFYITEDASDGTLRRYRPPANTEMGWDMLHQRNGIVDYLELIPSTMTFRWTTEISTGRTSANRYYRNSEGIAIHNGTLAFVSKVEKLLFFLDLDALTYTAVSTETPPTNTLPDGGSFDAQPDHVISYTTTTTTATESNAGNILFLTEDGGPTPGLFAYDGTEYFTVLESELGRYTTDEVTGIAFSPDGTVMYACLQDAGILLQIRRNDAQPFRHRRTLKWRKGLKL